MMQRICFILILFMLSLVFGVWTPTAKTEAKTDDVILAQNYLLYPVESAIVQPIVAQKFDPEQPSYFLTITLPESTENTFLRLSFSEQAQPGGAISLRLDLPKTAAFIRTDQNRASIAIKDTWIDETGTLWIEFDPPLAPKSQITIALQSRQAVAGAMPEFSVAAYPLQQNSGAIFVGMAQLQGSP